MQDDDDDFAPWTPHQAEILRETSAQLAEGILGHAARLVEIGADGAPAYADWDRASEDLRRLLQAYGEAVFEYTGSYDPISNVYPPMSELTDEDEEGFEEASTDRRIVTVLQRTDYMILDEDSILDAGIQAELANFPEETPAQVHRRIASAIPDGLYAISHASPHGWAALSETEGIQEMVSVTLVKVVDSPASTDGIGALDSVFDLEHLPSMFSQVEKF